MYFNRVYQNLLLCGYVIIVMRIFIHQNKIHYLREKN